MIPRFWNKETGEVVDKDTGEFGYSPRSFTTIHVKTSDGKIETFVLADKKAEQIELEQPFSWTNRKGPLRFLNQLR